MHNRRSVTTTAALAVLAMMALASPIGQAFACTAQAVMSLSPDRGQAGSTTTVTGQYFTATAVEIRWNSMTGPLLATVQGPSFETSIRIPADTQAGVYTIVAKGAEGGARDTYEVLPAPTTTTSTRPPSSTTTQPPPQSASATTAPPAASASGGISAEGSTSAPAPQAPSPDAGPAPVGASGQAAASASASAPTAARVTTTTASPPGGTLADTPSAPISSEISAAADEAAALTTSSTAVDENQELAVKPTSSSNGRSSRPMPGLLALVGLFVLGAVTFGHKFQRKPKP